MKKLLVISSLIITTMGLFILSAPMLLKVSGLDEPIKQAIVHSVFNDDQAQLSIDDIHVGLGEIHVDKLSVVSDRDGLQITIGGFDLHFSIYKLARIWESPLAAIDGIFLSSPKIRFSGSAQDKPRIADHQSLLSIRKLFKDFPNINYIGIRDGEIIYQPKDTREFVVGRRINGSIAQGQVDTMRIVLRGSASAVNVQNFTILMNLNERTEDWNGQVILKDFQIDSMMGQYFPSEIQIKKGILSVNGTLTGNLKKIVETRVNGTVRLINGSIVFVGQNFEDIQLDAAVDDNSLYSTLGYARINRNPLDYTLSMDDIFHPRADIHLQAKGFHLGRLLAPSNRILQNSCINLTASVTIDTNGVGLTGTVDQQGFKLWGDEVGRLHAELVYKNKILKASHLFLGDSSLFLEGQGRVDFKRGLSKIEMKGILLNSHNVLLNKMRYSRQEVRAVINYNSTKKEISGQWDYGITGPGVNLFSLGKIKGTAKEIIISTIRQKDTEFNFYAHLTGLNRSLNIAKVQVDNLPLARLSDDPLLLPFYQSHTLHSRLSGALNDLRGSLYFSDVRGKANYIFDGRIQNAFHKTVVVDGSVRVDNLTGSYHSQIDPHRLQAQFKFENTITGNFKVDWDSSAAISGKVALKGLNLYKVFNADIRDGDYRKEGTISGHVLLNGTLDKPRLRAHLNGERFVFNDVGYFQPNLKIRANRTRIDVEQIRVNYNNSPILDGVFTWFLLNNRVEGSFSGTGIDGQKVLAAMGMDSLLNGAGDYHFNVYGKAGDPEIDGAVNLKKGTLSSVAFDRLKIKFTDRIRSDKSFFSVSGHQIQLHELFMSQAGQYHLYAVGKVPLEPTGAMDLAVNFDGDLFRFLPHIELFFKDGSSITDVALHLTGTLNKIRLSSANIKIDRGDLWLKDVAPHIRNISGVLSLAEGSNQVHIKNFTAYVGDKYLQINTVHEARLLRSLNLKPWYFRGLNLDFGVLAMKTGKDGVTVHLPGLMKKDVTGNVRLSGRSPGQAFFLAGPVRHPHAFGALSLAHTRVTYPFLHEKGTPSKPSPAVQFLSAINWDVALSVGEDVIYERQIPAYIDNVQAELNIDEVGKGLVFNGSITDGTFKPVGSLESTRGRLDYLDQTFKVDRFKLTFDRFNRTPEISGQAWTTIRDSVGAIPKTIYLKLYTYDPATGQERLQGNWEDFRFKLISADPTIGETQEQVLAYLGYSVNNLKNKATKVGGALTERYLIRPLLRPIERALEQHLGIDLVRFNSSIARNIFYNTIGGTKDGRNVSPLINPFTDNFSYLYLMSSSEITIGKYLTQNLYLTYTGQLVSVYDKLKQSFDFNHSFGLEYRFYSNILIELEYDRERLGYLGVGSQQQYLEDFKIRLRQSFTF